MTDAQYTKPFFLNFFVSTLSIQSRKDAIGVTHFSVSPSGTSLPDTFATFVPLRSISAHIQFGSKHAKKHDSSASPSTFVNRQPKMRPTGDALLKRWHAMLGLTRQSPPSWYRDRLREELRERRLATTRRQKLSEASDVFFSSSRAQYDGFPVRKLSPLVTSRHMLVYAYMLAKFTSRWTFYRTAAFMCSAPRYDSVREVVNPSKDQKLEEVASRHRIDPVAFKRVGRQLRQVWPLLP